MFSHFLCVLFVGDFAVSDGPELCPPLPSTVPKQGGRDVPYGEKYTCYISFVQAGVMVLLAVNSMLMNQQYVLNKLSLNRNSHKTRLYIGRLMKMLCDRGLTKPNPVFPLGTKVWPIQCSK